LASSVSPYWVLLQIPNTQFWLNLTIYNLLYYPFSHFFSSLCIVSLDSFAHSSTTATARHVFQHFLKVYRCSDLLWDVTRWFICITNKEGKGTMSAHVLKVTSTYVTSTFIYNILGKLFKAILLEKHRQDCPNVWWLMSDVQCLMSDVSWLISDVRCPMSHFRCPMFDVTFPMSDVLCPVSDVWWLMSNMWCLMSNVWCSISAVWCLMSDVSWLTWVGLRKWDIGHQTSDIEHRTSNIKHPTSDVGHQTSDIRINGRCREVTVSGGSTVGRKTVLLGLDYCFRGVSMQNDGFVKVRDV